MTGPATYSTDNPFARGGAYSADNPFATPDPNAAIHAAYKSGALGRNIKSQNEKDAAQLSDHPLVTSILESAETPLAGVPGGALAMSAARGLSLGDMARMVADPTQTGSMLARAVTSANQADINRETSDTKASWLGRGIGGIATSGVLPASGLQAGAIMGGADQLLNNDPSAQTLGQRVARGAGGAVVGGVVGGLADRAISAVRSRLVPSASKQVAALQDARSAADNALDSPSYATANDQGRKYYVDLANREEEALANNAAAPATRLKELSDKNLLQYGQFEQAPKAVAGPAVGPVPQSPLTDWLDSDTVAPYAKLARSFEQNKGADDYTIATDTYKLMSEAQGKKLALTARGDFAAAPAGQLKSLGIAKQQGRSAIGEVAPDFNAAVDQHRILSGELTANRQGYGLGQKLLAGAPTAGQIQRAAKPNGTVYDPEHFLGTTVPEMSQAEAAQAERGLLASIKARGMNGGFSLNPRTAFGMAPSEPTLNALHALDTRIGNTRPQTLRAAIQALLQQRQAASIPDQP